MRMLSAESLEAQITDDRVGLEMLEFGRISTGLGSQADELDGAFKTTIVIRRNVRDEVGRMVVADRVLADREFS